MTSIHRTAGRPSLRGLVLLMTGLALAACEPRPESAAARSVSLCDVVRAGCERQVACRVFVYNAATEIDACVAASGCAAQEATYLQHGVTLLADAAKRCIDGLSASRCDELFVTDDSSGSISALEIIPGCRDLFAGTRPEGASCVENVECSPGLKCDVSGFTCPGACAELECTVGGCGEGRFCSVRNDVCLTRSGAGEPCEASEFENSCVDGYRCGWDSEARQERCEPQIPFGQPCHQLDLFVCEGDATCDTDLNVCGSPHPLGSACSTASECVYGAYCDFSDRTCRPWGAEDDSCSAAWLACGPGLYCLRYLGDVACVDDGGCGPGQSCCGGACVPATDEDCDPYPLGTCRPEPDYYTPLQPAGVQEVFPRPVASAGQSCNDAVCGLGLACRPVDDSFAEWRCEAGPQLGESCKPDDPYEFSAAINERVHDALAGCGEGVCDILASWTCVEPKPAGSACSYEGVTRECQSQHCEDGRCLEFLSSCARPPSE
ncbi:hypothetical protein [Nannocystis exedens]|nr:hypothetical protein [Nannocystis exedens]